MHQPLTHTLGFPRIGANRELKHVIEAFWRGEADEAALHRVARAIRKAGWRLQREAGIDLPASNDFSFYDQVLDTLCLVGALPRRFDAQEATVSLGTMFALARGSQQQRGGLRPLSMTKWFDTNYHHLVPELAPDMRFRLASDKPFDEFREALGLGILTKPVLVGPVTLLGLGRPAEGVAPFDRWSLLPALTEIYVEVLRRLTALGADWIQLDEPLLALDLDEGARAAFTSSYAALTRGAPGSRVMVASYYGPLRENLATYLALPVAGLHYDVVRGADDDEWSRLLTAFPRGKVLSAGVVDGRNVWRTDLARAWANLERARAAVTSAGLMVAPSCSLLHVPHSLQDEGQLAAPLRRRLAFATEKLAEVATLARALRGEDVAQAIADSQQASAAPVGLQGLGALAAVGNPSGAIRRRQPFAQRRILQQMRAPLPLLPTTTIGSFPQTAAVRQARARWRKGQLTTASYEALLEAETAAAIARQEAVGLDLLVHGEFERTDMVEYFAEQLEGFAVTDHGWVQSYGTRCWKPPIVHGPVSRPGP